MGKRKTSKKRGDDCKREKGEEVIDQKKMNEKEELRGEDVGISEKKFRTCNPKMIKDLIKEVAEKLYKHLESNQIKGFNHLGIAAITSRERKHEDVLFEQMAYHLKKHHGINHEVMKAVYGDKWKPKDFNVYWKEARNAMTTQYRTTEIGEILEEIFKTYEVDEYVLVAQKGEVVLELLGKLKVLLKKTYQLSESKLTIKTEVSEMSVNERIKKWEEEGEIIAKEAFKDIRALGASMTDKVTNIDLRADRVVTDVINREVRVPRDDMNVFGGLQMMNDPDGIDEKISNVVEKLEERLMREQNMEAERSFIEKLLKKLNNIRQMKYGWYRMEAFEGFIVSVFEELARVNDLDEDENLFLTMDGDELKETYKEALEDVLGRLNARQYDERPDKVAEIEAMAENSYENIKENAEDSSEGIPVSMGPGVQVSTDNGGNDGNDENDTSDEGWNIIGKFKVLATKLSNISVQCNEESEPENIEVKMFKVSVAETHANVRDVCEGVGGIQELLPKVLEKKTRLWNLIDQPETEEKKQKTIAVIKELTEWNCTFCELEDLLIGILTEVELGIQFTIKTASEVVKRLTKSYNPNLCYAVIAEVTTEDVMNYKVLQQWRSLPKAMKPETLQIIKRTVRTFMRYKKYKIALKICLHVTRVKAMWKASVIMKISVIRYAELKALEISLNIGQRVGFSRKRREDLKQIENTIHEFTGIEVAKKSEKRLNPNPVLIEDVFEALETRIAEERKGNHEGETIPEGWKAYQDQEDELIRVLSKILRRNHPTKFTVISTPAFKDYPLDCVEHAPTDGKERIDIYESQLGKYTIQVEVKDIDIYDKPEDYPGYEADVDDAMLGECTGSGGMESITKYPGLEEADEETRVLVIAEVIILPKGKDDIKCNGYETRIPKESYGGALQVPGNLFFEREMSRRRAIFGGDSVTQNSNLSLLSVNGAKLRETSYSCGSGCKINDRRCPSEQRNISEEDRRREVKYNLYRHGMCAKEWFVKAKSHVNCHVAGEVFNSSTNFNGDGVIVEQLAVANKDKKLHHQVIRVVKMCVLLNETLADQVITYMELLADRPLVIATHMPENLGDDDVNGRVRPVDILRVGSLYTPRYVANGAWVVANCSVGSNVTDERTTVPSYRKLHMCKICNKMFLSPTSLYIHLLYQEKVLGDINSMDEDHSDCKRFTVCKCRLLKKLKTPTPQNEEEDFKSYEKEDVNKIGDRDYDLYSLVQLNTFEFTDLALMELYQFLDIFILLNQIGMHVYLPGGYFANRHGLHMARYWQRTHVFGNLYKPVMVTTRGTGYNYLPGDTWKLEKHSSLRMSHRGEVFEIGIKEAAAELVESANNATSSERFGSVGCTGLLIKPESIDEEKIKLLEDRDEEELKVLKCFFNPHQEILHHNILKQFLTAQPENQTETNLRKLQVLRILKQAYQERAIIGGVDLPALRKIPIGEDPLAKESLFDTYCGEIINATPKNIATEAFEVNLNVLDGKEIFPNMVLNVNVPATTVEPKIKEITNLIARRIKSINEKGWRQNKGKPKGLENAKKKCDDFSVQPKMKEEDREKKLAEIRKRMEKENAENIRAVRERWWCKRCKLAGKHFYEHRNGCYAQMKAKQERKDANAEIRDEIEENTRKRIAKEMEELEKKENKVDDSKTMEVGDETSDNDEDAVVDEDPVQDIFNNQTIRSMDREATNEDTQNGSAHVSMSGEILGELEPILYSRGDNQLDIITEENEPSEDSEKDAFNEEDVEEDMDEKVRLRMQQRTTRQVESDNKIQEMVDAIIDTWDNDGPVDKVKKEQRNLAKGILKQTKEMAKLGYSLVTWLRGSGGEIIDEDINDGMEAIEEVSDDEEGDENINEVVTQETFEEHLDSVAVAVHEELPQINDNETVEVGEQNVAANPLEAPGPEPWCGGGIDEAQGEYVSCGRRNCRQCYQF